MVQFSVVVQGILGAVGVQIPLELLKDLETEVYVAQLQVLPYHLGDDLSVAIPLYVQHLKQYIAFNEFV